MHREIPVAIRAAKSVSYSLPPLARCANQGELGVQAVVSHYSVALDSRLFVMISELDLTFGGKASEASTLV